MLPVLHDKNEVRNRSEELGEVLWQGRQWAVTEDGLECRDGTYAIETKRLSETWDDGSISWLHHMGGKEWVDKEDFATAFFVALTLHGTKHAFTREHFTKGVKALFRYS